MNGIERLLEPLPTEVFDLDSADQRLEDIAKLCDSGRWADASTAVEELFEAGIFDVRPIVHYLFAHYRLGGLSTLSDLLRVVSALAAVRFETVGPVRKRLDHVRRRVSWLFQQIAQDIEFQETRKTATWADWEATVSHSAVESWIASARALDVALPPECDEVRQALTLLVVRLRRLQVVVAPGADEAKVEEPPAEVVPEIAAPPEEPPRIRVGSQSAVLEIRPAHQFFELADKLKAFTDLVERGDFAKAAIVADDVTHLIEHFDPRSYFPGMFSDFAKLMSEHISAVAEEWSRKDSLTWRAQAEFYKVDLKRFVAK